MVKIVCAVLQHYHLIVNGGRSSLEKKAYAPVVTCLS